MKRTVALLLLCLALCLPACRFCRAEPKEAFALLDGVAGQLGRFQLTQDRALRVAGRVQTEAGSAWIRVRMNSGVIELVPDAEGFFEAELSLESGGNYIMVCYEDFVGTVELTAEYPAAEPGPLQ